MIQFDDRGGVDEELVYAQNTKVIRIINFPNNGTRQRSFERSEHENDADKVLSSFLERQVPVYGCSGHQR